METEWVPPHHLTFSRSVSLFLNWGASVVGKGAVKGYEDEAVRGQVFVAGKRLVMCGTGTW